MTMNRKILLGGFVVMASVALAMAAPEAKDPILKAGTYRAHVAAIPCEGCPPVIEQTMLAQPGIGAAKADMKTSSLTFTVKADSKVSVADLQKALKTASDQMGMGADYSLKNIQKS
jgi:hypothetical protein